MAVFISRSESQGLALAEAWAMDVPTLVWQGPPGDGGSLFNLSDPSPYLTSHTGVCPAPSAAPFAQQGNTVCTLHTVFQAARRGHLRASEL